MKMGSFLRTDLGWATPQQHDGLSYGAMVIRNARLGMNGLSVGAWETSWIRNA